MKEIAVEHVRWPGECAGEAHYDVERRFRASDGGVVRDAPCDPPTVDRPLPDMVYGRANAPVHARGPMSKIAERIEGDIAGPQEDKVFVGDYRFITVI